MHIHFKFLNNFYTKMFYHIHRIIYQLVEISLLLL